MATSDVTTSDLFISIWAGVALLILLGCGPFMLWCARRRLPWTISDRLLRGKSRVRVRTTFANGAWNPAKPPGRGNHTAPVRGTATYLLSPEGRVVLDLRTADGRHEQFVGPAVTRPANVADRVAGRVVGVVVLVYAVAATIGALLGHTVDHAKVMPMVVGGVLGVVAVTTLVTIASALARRRPR